MKSIKKISCFGAGYVGGPTMAVFASKHPHIQFTIYDIDKQQIEKWQQSETLPVFESGLSLLLEETRNKNLSFTSDIKEALDEVDIVFLAVNTPIKQSLSKKESYCFDIKYIEACTRSIAEYFDQKKLNKIITLVEKSTVPVLTSKHIYEILQENQVNNPSNKNKFVVLSNPEFLSEDNYFKQNYFILFLQVKYLSNFIYLLIYVVQLMIYLILKESLLEVGILQKSRTVQICLKNSMKSGQIKIKQYLQIQYQVNFQSLFQIHFWLKECLLQTVLLLCVSLLELILKKLRNVLLQTLEQEVNFQIVQQALEVLALKKYTSKLQLQQRFYFINLGCSRISIHL
ncbi:hypothetical protein ABPG72_006062 [Tetrahymena utriculariae]